ncbi:MAG: molybdopterin-dependent oxidoreductase [Deltaproteobacteria bacterium]|nr:molybdopterin-dependent oxidoreductase [Deltaproteobacteria bacterium]
MKIDRRGFIKLAVGAVAGLHLTPIPWKLMDDSAIWTQNWPWVPVPDTGEATYVNTVCSLCPGGCGIKVRVIDGKRAVKIEGNPEHPVNRGGICPMGAAGLQLLYSLGGFENKSATEITETALGLAGEVFAPQKHEGIRVPGPIKRVGARGAGRWERISWEEAMNTLVAELRKIRDSGRPQALASITGRQDGSMPRLLARFLKAFGSPNAFTIPSAEDTAAMAVDLTMGAGKSLGFDLERAQYILSFGSALFEGWGSPVRMMRANGLWRDKSNGASAKIVQIDTSSTLTASKADQWISVKPGTEGALALGLAHVIIKEGKYDKDFVGQHCFGFENWSDDKGPHQGFKEMVLKDYTPEEVFSLTGVPAEKIVALANDFASVKPAVALYGKGKGSMPGSLFDLMAVNALNALVGSINREGGMVLTGPAPIAAWPEAVFDEIAKKGNENPRLDEARTRRYPLTKELFYPMARTVTRTNTPLISTLIVYHANPCYGAENGDFNRALEKIPFVVSLSPYMDETTAMADLVLPGPNYLEGWDDHTTPPGMQFPIYSISRPVVAAQCQVTNPGDVLIKAAQALGGSVAASFPWADYKELLTKNVEGVAKAGVGVIGKGADAWKKIGPTAPALTDAKFDNLVADTVWYNPTLAFNKFDGVFTTPSGKFEFYSRTMVDKVGAQSGSLPSPMMMRLFRIRATGDKAFMPHYEPPFLNGATKEFPLLLVPQDSIDFPDGYLAAPPYLTKTWLDTQVLKNDMFVQMNPATAKEHRLQEGDYVKIVTSTYAEIKTRVNLFDGIRPGLVAILTGLGHKAFDRFVKGKGANANDVFVLSSDPLSGFAQWWGTRIKLEKI